jgi:hypothetical protein
MRLHCPIPGLEEEGDSLILFFDCMVEKNGEGGARVKMWMFVGSVMVM